MNLTFKFMLSGLNFSHFCKMELLNFIFRLGVIFAIFGFLFGIFELGLTILQGGRKKNLYETYFIRLIKYMVLVSVTFLFCVNLDEGKISNYHVVVSSLVLLVYFIGKLQSKQQQQIVFSQFNQFGKNMNLPSMGNFSLKGEIIVISIAIALFFSMLFFPQVASNRLSLWFHESIINIEDTPVFGFIFKIIGFFFVVNMIMKMLNGIAFLTSGRAFMKVHSSIRNGEDEDKFDDYEEMK